MKPTVATVKNLDRSALSPDVLAAMHAATRHLREHGIRHAVLGALAVGVHGWPRATRDVDLLVSMDAWEVMPDGQHRARIPLPEQIGGVGVDHLPTEIAGPFLEEALDRALVSEGVHIAPIEVVILTKLLRMLSRDETDVVELLKAGLFDPSVVVAYLAEHTPMLSRRFAALSQRAAAEKAYGA